MSYGEGSVKPQLLRGKSSRVHFFPSMLARASSRVLIDQWLAFDLSPSDFCLSPSPNKRDQQKKINWTWRKKVCLHNSLNRTWRRHEFHHRRLSLTRAEMSLKLFSNSLNWCAYSRLLDLTKLKIWFGEKMQSNAGERDVYRRHFS